MEDDTEPYFFVETDYNKTAFTLNENKTAATLNQSSWAMIHASRPLGCSHRLIIKSMNADIAASDDAYLHFTSCTGESLRKNSHHLNGYCSESVCGGVDMFEFSIGMKKGSSVTISRTAGNKCLAVFSDPPAEKLLDINVNAGVPIIPVLYFGATSQKLEIMSDESYLNQIQALKLEKQNKRQILVDLCSDIQEMKSLMAATTAKLDLQIDQLVQNQVMEAKEMKLKISEQEEQISEQLQQIASMKVGSAPAACDQVDSSSWLSNRFVAVADSLIQRIGQIDDKNYIFRCTPFAIDSKITFTIHEVNVQFSESLTFGVTVFSPDHLDMQSLPANGQKLKIKSTSFLWYVAHDFVPNPKAKLIVSLTRTEAGILMKTEAEEKLLFAVDPFICVFPFFLFDGSVQSVELKEFKVQNRSGGECVICLKQPATTRVKPCDHLLYCSDCHSGAVVCNDDGNCPICGTGIKKYKQVRFN